MSGVPVVRVGQLWAPRCPWYAPVRVLAVDRAAVWTDQGRTTVFALARRRRLMSDPAATAA